MSTQELAARYALPPEVVRFIDSGFLEIVCEEPQKNTIEFHIPSKQVTDIVGRITSYSLVWIHPAHNAEFCQYYAETPGDLPNFHVIVDTTDLGDEMVDGLETVEDLTGWLEALEGADLFRP